MIPADTSPRRSAAWVFPLLLQPLAGLALGVTCGFLGAATGTWLLRASSANFGETLGGILGLLAAYPFGAALGVWLPSAHRHYGSSLWMALAGAYLGSAIALLALVLGLRADARILWIGIALLSLLGALLGHAVARKRSAT